MVRKQITHNLYSYQNYINKKNLLENEKATKFRTTSD